MAEVDAAALRETVRFLDRFRATIEDEVDRRLGRGEPSPEARLEIVRRFRSFVRLASIDLDSARPSLDGLGGNSPAGLEKAIEIAVDVAGLCEPPAAVMESLRGLEARFRTGIRRIMRPSEPERKQRRGRRRALHGGKRVRAAIDRIGDAYLALDLESGRLADLNPAAEVLLGAPAVTVIERPFVDLIEPEARPAFGELEARLDADEDTGPVALALQRHEGKAVPVEVSVANHTISGRRLAIFIAREQLRAQPLAAHPSEAPPPVAPGGAPLADERARRQRTRRSVSAVVRSLLGPFD
jgi:PAS domain S-box-containing protein